MAQQNTGWHLLARRMWASGRYPSKAAVARELGVSRNHIYEVLSEDAGRSIKDRRWARAKERRQTDAEYRAQKAALSRAWRARRRAETAS